MIVIYDCKTFMVQATDLILSTSNLLRFALIYVGKMVYSRGPRLKRMKEYLK
jgi:hypothetical protein